MKAKNNTIEYNKSHENNCFDKKKETKNESIFSFMRV